MSRPSLRRTPKLESLETRQVLSSVAGPTADKQYVLELINLVRTNPSAAADRFTTNLSADVQATLKQYGLTPEGLRSELKSAAALPPLAYHDALDSTAQSQSRDEAVMGKQTHTGADGSSLGARLRSANYNLATAGENTYAYAESVDQAMQSFLFDWGVADRGHFKNLLQPGVSAQKAYKDVGVGLVNTSGTGVGPLVITTDFGSEQNDGPQIVGVVFKDLNHDNFYTPGEGQAGVTITATDSTGQVFSTPTWQSGGYQLAVPTNMDYTVAASVNGQFIGSRRVHVGDVNAKVDFVLDGSPPPAPAPTPVVVAPAPAPALVAAPVVVALRSVAVSVVAPAPAPAAPIGLARLSGWSRWQAIDKTSR